jgi:hypothetical protein
MTKFQTKQMRMIQIYINSGMVDVAARSLSALIRSAMSVKAKNEMLDIARQLNLKNHSEFIV